jgi:hypothetical protein
VAEEFDCNIRVCDVVKNSLPEKILLKGAWISVECRFGLRRAVKVMPSLGGHLAARHGPQLSQAHLL